MSLSRRSLFRAGLAALALSGTFASFGCAAFFRHESPYMRPLAQPQPLRPPPGQALVVFVRPSAFAGAMGGNVLDEKGRFLGDTQPESLFAVPVLPGRHLFLIWAENTDGLVAEVAAGKTYYVEVAPTMGAFSARMHLFAVKPGQPSWDKLQGWLASSRPFVSDYAAGQQHLATRGEDVAERIRRAQEHLRNYQGEDKDRRTLSLADGV